MPPAPNAPPSETLTAAVTHGRAFLRARLAAGNYGLACYGSQGGTRFSHDKGHVFTGFFLARALAGTLTEIERTILLVRILSEENGGCWGFSPPHPYVGPEHRHFVVDADDTAYVLRTCRLLGAFRPTEPLFKFHRPSGGGFVTFATDETPKWQTEPACEHNLGLHPEVNANVALVLKGTHHEAALRYELASELQRADGSWPSYFYPAPAFASRLFLELIHDRDYLADARRRGLEYLVGRQQPTGAWSQPADSWHSALALGALALGSVPGLDEATRDACHHGLARGAAWLAAQAHADGGWQSTSVIWQFPDRGGDVWQARDEHGALVTAVAVEALTLAATRLAGNPLSLPGE